MLVHRSKLIMSSRCLTSSTRQKLLGLSSQLSLNFIIPKRVGVNSCQCYERSNFLLFFVLEIKSDVLLFNPRERNDRYRNSISKASSTVVKDNGQVFFFIKNSYIGIITQSWIQHTRDGPRTIFVIRESNDSIST